MSASIVFAALPRLSWRRPPGSRALALARHDTVCPSLCALHAGGDLLAPVSQPPETPFAPLRMPGDGPVVVCIITYQPFSFLMSSQDSIPGARSGSAIQSVLQPESVAFDSIFRAGFFVLCPAAGVYAESDQSDFTGYDIELIEMLFGTDAGLDKRGVVYKAFPKRRLMWIALRSALTCAVAAPITAHGTHVHKLATGEDAVPSCQVGAGPRSQR